MLPEPPPLLPPPPPNQGRPWAPVAALALIVALFAATVGGGLLFSRLIAAGIAVHVINDPTTVRIPTLPAVPRPPGAADIAALQGLLVATPSTPGVTIDRNLATQMATALWPVRERAIDSGDVALLSTFETGAALEGDTDLYGNQGCGCSTRLPRTAQWTYVFVPKQTTYPASFLAEMPIESVNVGDPGVVLLLFSRASAQTPWNVALATEYLLHTTGPPEDYVDPVPSGDFNVALPSTPSGVAALPADLAAYYEYWSRNGMAPPKTVFEPGFFTSYKGGEVFVHGETDGVDGIHHEVYSTDAKTDGEWAFAGESFTQTPQYGWIISCGTVRYEDVFTAASGAKPLTQPLDHSTWGPTLVAGSYSQITQWGLHESCFVTDPTGRLTLVLGNDGGATRSSGVPVATQ